MYTSYVLKRLLFLVLFDLLQQLSLDCYLTIITLMCSIFTIENKNRLLVSTKAASPLT